MEGLKNISGTDFTVWEKAIPRHVLVDRDETILTISRGKSVLHIGAADSPFHLQKAEKQELLHQKLQAVASDLIGVDVDRKAVEQLRQEHGIATIEVGDLTSPVWAKGKAFDVVLCCDVIEHVDEPGALIQAAVNVMHSNSILLVSVPNGAALKNVIRAAFGREAVHPDHVACYTFSTLCTLLERHKIKPLFYGGFAYVSNYPRLAFLLNGVCKMRPGLADGLLIVGLRIP